MKGPTEDYFKFLRCQRRFLWRTVNREGHDSRSEGRFVFINITWSEGDLMKRCEETNWALLDSWQWQNNWAIRKENRSPTHALVDSPVDPLRLFHKTCLYAMVSENEYLPTEQ